MTSFTKYQISYDYLQKFLDYEAFCFEKVLIFPPPDRYFLLISTSVGMLHCLSFQDIEDHRFIYVCAKFLVQGLPIKSFTKVQSLAYIKLFHE